MLTDVGIGKKGSQVRYESRGGTQMFTQKAKIGWLLLMLSGCTGNLKLTGITTSHQDGGEQNLAGDMDVQNPMLKFDINQTPVNKLVCEPFSDTQSSDPKFGLSAEMVFRGPLDPRMYSVGDYFAKLPKNDQQLFFKDLNVPTRMFYQGFSTPGNELLKNSLGQPLIEYFAIKFNSNLILGRDDSEGTYELAILSDDGARLNLDQGAGLKNFIDNDGDHPTRLGCSTQTLTLKRGQRVPLEYFYYQGPRYHISNILLWRKVDSANRSAEPLCGQLGNHLFFNPDNGSAVMPAYNQLLSRGWSPVKEENFLLSDGDPKEFNPCVEAVAPVISNVKLTIKSESEVLVTWNTDKPATSQVLVKEVSTGLSIVPNSDLILRTQHSLLVQGLNPNTRYSVQAVSVSEDLGRAISSVVQLDIP